MASLEDLKNALKETLDSRGVLSEIKAKIRSEIFSALDDQEVARPKLTDENLIINELIREYLSYNNYHHAASVLLAETGQPSEPPFDRAYLARELRVAEDSKSRSVPLLYGLVRGLRPNAQETQPQSNFQIFKPPS
mmetsp:Transcript_4493/g.6785  ORF Transcript_4493/g.6785 Transcript_4493/m.6785 type:complete len:136 (+) Transcript_4493:558-965(+)